MATGISYRAMSDSFYKRSNETEMFLSKLDEVAAEYNFDSVKSCVAIGTGAGILEIGFIEKCTASVTKFIAIEEDHEAAVNLRSHMRRRLPDVEGLAIEGDYHSWKGPSEPVDLVLAFHCLYPHYFNDIGERQSMLKNIHDSWLNAGGFLVVLAEGSWSGNSIGDAGKLYDRLGYAFNEQFLDADILEAGFIKKHYFEFQYLRDFSNPDEALLRYYSSNILYSVTDDEVRCLIKELYPDGKAHGCYTLALFQKAL